METFRQKTHTIYRELVSVPAPKGLTETIRILYRLADKAAVHPEFTSFVKRNFSGKNSVETFRKIHRYLNTYVKYINDDYEETLVAPYLLTQTGGDCDDFSLFAYTALKILGLPAGLIIMGTGKGFDHIMTVSYDETGKLYVIDGTNSQFNHIPLKYNRFRYV